MSSDVAIRIDGVGKTFAIYERPHHRLLQLLMPSAQRPWFREFHALRDVSFEVGRGETVGIVGRNGSGKSTLLQIICGTLTASAGSIDVRGRVAALLELGSGFNPDFTGRENVYLNGAVLGLPRAEVERRFDDIVAFADIGDFIDQPVKSYSSGMYVRLAFSVAINVSPDILVVDEALSVGDEAFQRKCFSRIQRMRDDGATVLFVSHSAGHVIELCDRALLLDRGELLLAGKPRHVIARYHKLAFAPPELAESIREQIRGDVDVVGAEPAATADLPHGAASDDGELDAGMVPVSTVSYPSRGARIFGAHVQTLSGRRVNVLRAGATYVYTYCVAFDADAARARCGMLIKSVTGLELAGAVSATRENAVERVAAGDVLEARFEFRCLLAPGTYFLNAGVQGQVGDADVYLDRQIDVAMFRVMPEPGRLATAW
ncbi:MAG TPA: ABC transporter ATP-binding protein, partial [Tahibacter sp.]|nr:ABC transporter ATP-binding protein [Tahibacter sp.]